MAESNLVTSALGFEYCVCELSVMAYWDILLWLGLWNKPPIHPLSNLSNEKYDPNN